MTMPRQQACLAAWSFPRAEIGRSGCIAGASSDSRLRMWLVEIAVPVVGMAEGVRREADMLMDSMLARDETRRPSVPSAS